MAVGTLTVHDEAGDAAQPFDRPTAICVDQWGNVFVANCGADGNHSVVKVSFSGTCSLHAGGKQGYRNHAQGHLARFDTPMGVCCDARGNVFVRMPRATDCGNHCIRKTSLDGSVCTVARRGAE